MFPLKIRNFFERNYYLFIIMLRNPRLCVCESRFIITKNRFRADNTFFRRISEKYSVNSSIRYEIYDLVCVKVYLYLKKTDSELMSTFFWRMFQKCSVNFPISITNNQDGKLSWIKLLLDHKYVMNFTTLCLWK